VLIKCVATASLFLLLLPGALADEDETPPVVKFVAPAYPRAAKDQRIMGTTLTRIVVNADGTISDASTIRAHPIFERYVLDALKAWRFKPSDKKHILQISCSFEMTNENCEGTDKEPITPEVHVSAELPNLVHIVTGVQCKEISLASKNR
jgi:TonB family protein